MTDPRAPYFEAARTALGGQITGRYYTASKIIDAIDAVLDLAKVPRVEPDPITVVGSKPFDRAEFLARHINLNAPAITDSDIAVAAAELEVGPPWV